MRKKHLSTFGLIHSSYEKTLTRLFDVFGRDSRYVDICKTMFDDAIVTRLGRFWGIELSPAPVDKIVCSFRNDNTLTYDEYMLFRAGYAEMIAAVEKWASRKSAVCGNSDRLSSGT